MRNLHDIGPEIREGELLPIGTPSGGVLTEWFEAYQRDRRYQQLWIDPVPVTIEGNFRSEWTRVVREGNAIFDRLRRRAFELRYNNRNTDDLALVISPEEARALRQWQIDTPYYLHAMPIHGPETVEGIRIVVR